MNLPTRVVAVTVLAVAMVVSGLSALAAPTATPRQATNGSPPLGSAATAGLSADQADRTVGRWEVTRTGEATYTVTWTAPQPLPITDARPLFEDKAGLVAVPRLASDGRTLSADVTAATPPDPDTLDVVVSGRALDAPPPPVTTRRDVITPLPHTTSLSPDPGRPGPHPITSSEYELPGVKMPGMPAEIEMLGRIVRPTDATPGAPVVLFLHGRHDYCYVSPHPTGSGDADWPCPRGTSPVPSYLGYVYVQKLLAHQGYVTVSISANGINAQDYRLADGGSAARAALIRKHLAAWLDPANATAIGEAVSADLTNVVLVGHSRGGEGANRASASIPLTAPYQISGQVLIGPTDFGRQSAPYIPTVTMLPYCDGDVSDLQGQTFTDVARDQVQGDTALHSSLMVMGANHNFFNTEWTPGISAAPSFDDWFSDGGSTCSYGSPSRLTKKEQRAVGRSYIAGAVALMTRQGAAMLPLFDGSRVSLASAGDTDVRSHAVGLGRLLRSPGRNATLSPDSTPTSRICTGRSSGRRIAAWCGRGLDSSRTPHWPGDFPSGAPARPALEFAWERAGAIGGLSFRRPIDIVGRALHIRTIVDQGHGAARLSVRVVDDTGRDSTVRVPALPPLPVGPFVLSKRWAQDLVVDASRFDPGVDLAHVVEVDLVSRDVAGRVWVLDIAAGDGSLPAVPVKRAGTLSLSDVTVLEGNGQGQRLAKVPFHISGDVSSPTRFRVAPAGFFGVRFGAPIDVFVPAGRRDGTVAVPYESNRIDDLRRRDFDLAAYAVKGAMPTDYTGRLRVLDDDPKPTMTLRSRRSPIREGWQARWTVRLSKPVNYYDTAVATVVAGPSRTPGLRVGDVPRAWLREHLVGRTPPGSKPLDRLSLVIIASIRPGQRRLTLGIPTPRDRVRERLEHVTLRVRLDQVGRSASRTIAVQDVPFRR